MPCESLNSVVISDVAARRWQLLFQGLPIPVIRASDDAGTVSVETGDVGNQIEHCASDSSQSVSDAVSILEPSGVQARSALTVPLPKFTDRVLPVIQTNNVSADLGDIVEETAYHILKHGDFETRSDYDEYGRWLYEQYPSVLVFPAQNHGSVCLFFVTNLV